MSRPTTKKKLRAIFRAGLWGVALSFGFSLFALHPGQSGDGLFWCLVFLMPTAILSNAFGLETTPGWRGFANSLPFMVMANVLFFTFAFVICACVWQFFVKGHGEKTD
jgi:hypothetical protein